MKPAHHPDALTPQLPNSTEAQVGIAQSFPSRPLPFRKHLAGAIVAIALTLSLASLVALGLVTRTGHQIIWLLTVIGTAACLAFPTVKAVSNWLAFRRNWASGNVVAARVDVAQLRHHLLRVIGASGFLSFAFILVIFFTAGNDAVQKTFLQWNLVQLSFAEVLKALWINVLIAIVAQILSMIGGLVLAIGRLLPGRSLGPIRTLAIAYIDVFRGLPAVIVIYLVCFGLPITGIPILSEGSPIVYAVIALTMTFSAYNAEIFRAGIEGVNESQTAAAYSLGMTRVAVMRLVILPQAIRAIMAPLLSLFIALQKDTALVNVVGIIDAFTQAKIFSSQHFNLSAISVVCFLFILLTIPQTRLVDALLARSDKRQSRTVLVD